MELQGGAILSEITTLQGAHIQTLNSFEVFLFHLLLLSFVEDNCGNQQEHSDVVSMKVPTTCDDTRDAALGFQLISHNGCLWNCVAVLNGYHPQIQTA